MHRNQYYELKEQSRFCATLAKRLFLDLETARIEENGDVTTVNNHTRISADIVRLRRELNTLNKLLND